MTDIHGAIERIRKYIDATDDAPNWGGPTMLPARPDIADLRGVLAAIEAMREPHEPIAWVSPLQLSSIADRPGDTGGEYIPVRKSKAGNFTMPLYGAPRQRDEQTGDGA